MGHKFNIYGIEAFQDWWQGNKTITEERFPTVTICKFQIRTLGDNLHPYNVQCLLPINLYNEKVIEN